MFQHIMIVVFVLFCSSGSFSGCFMFFSGCFLLVCPWISPWGIPPQVWVCPWPVLCLVLSSLCWPFSHFCHLKIHLSGHLCHHCHHCLLAFEKNLIFWLGVFPWGDATSVICSSPIFTAFFSSWPSSFFPSRLFSPLSSSRIIPFFLCDPGSFQMKEPAVCSWAFFWSEGSSQ